MKIAIFTGSRAEYGLFKPLLTQIEKDDASCLQLIVSGMHLAPEFGFTYQTILEDGFHIDEKVEILLSSDSETAMLKSMGLGLIGFGEVLERLAPDVAVVLGDRFETFTFATACHVKRIPLAHIHGGELTEGAVDDAFRHSVTKMSCLHFASTEAYRNRIIQLGEAPERVFNVGALGVENINTLNWLDREALEEKLGVGLSEHLALVTYHPETLGGQTIESQMEAIFEVCDACRDYQFIFTKANSDTSGRKVNDMIEDYVARSGGRCGLYASLGTQVYLSLAAQCRFVMGNSSSGLIEMPYLQVPTINIGNRQNGRVRASSVIDCEGSFSSILQAIEQAETMDTKNFDLPYGRGDTSIQILDTIKKHSERLRDRKMFYDLNRA